MMNNTWIALSLQTGAVTAVAVSHDSTVVVSGGEDRCVVIWEPSSESWTACNIILNFITSTWSSIYMQIIDKLEKLCALLLNIVFLLSKIDDYIGRLTAVIERFFFQYRAQNSAFITSLFYFIVQEIKCGTFSTHWHL
jgi:WD40 repeat protein